MGGWQGRQVIGSKNEKDLRRLLKDCSFSANRKDWGIDIPLEFVEVPLDMTPKQAAAYKSMHDDFLYEVEKEDLIEAKSRA